MSGRPVAEISFLGTGDCRPVQRRVGESGGDEGDLSDPKSDAEIAEKLLALAGGVSGAARAPLILERLSRPDTLDDVAQVPRDFVQG